MNNSGQSAAFDVILVLLSISIFIAVVSSFMDDGVMEAETVRVREDYTHSLLVSLLRCTTNQGSEYGNKTVSDLIAFHFQNSSGVNDTLADEITEMIGLYTENKGVEWVVYGNKTDVLWIPYGKILSGREISSSSAEVLLPDKKAVRIYLFIKWG
jgi:hypothetical protein